MDQAAESPFTPGPWTVEEYGDEESPALVIHSDIDFRICFMATPGLRDDPATIEANANLIAAAPDMLALLKRLRQWDHLDGAADGPFWKRELDAVIDNATALTTGDKKREPI